VISKLGGKRFSIDNSSTDTIKSSRSNMTSEGLTTASEPVRVQSITETESMDYFVHNADHLSFMSQDISSGGKVSSTDGSLTNNGSTRARSSGASGGTGNIRTRSISLNYIDPISVDTRLKDRRSGDTADAAGTDLHASSSRILALEGSREVVHNRRNKLVLDVVSNRAASGTELSIVAICSKVRVTGEGSSGVVITFKVEIFFDIFEGSFLMVLFIMSTFMFEGLSKSEETDDV
jgi:hypothetical protein